MARPALIGFTGPARSGKDACANFALAAIGGYKYSFADPIRAMLVPLGVDMSDPYWQVHKEQVIPALGVSPRRLMQTLGTEWGRQLINPDLWLLMAKQRLYNNGHGMIIADVRFENEADFVRSNGGLLVHVVRKDVSDVEAHSSEAGVERKPTDAILFNNGTLEELQIAVRGLLNVYET